ncbi:MAG: hypothetical protein QM763_25120 [Agriterribacter sp.]
MKAYKLYLLFIMVTMLFACVKKLEDILPAGTVNPSKADTTKATESAGGECTPPDYGDSVLCYQWLGGKDYKVSPVNNPGKGKYISTPEGLVIDNNTGEINVTKSESGLKYKIGFIRDGFQDTCFTTVITSGINYLDGIHVLSDNDTLLVPIYNGDPTYYPVCGSNVALNGCEYDDDEDDDNGNGLADEPPAGFTLASNNIAINKQNGVIRLKRSVLDGLFGTLNPQNGKTVNTTLYYRLSDCSNGALRRIDIKFTYYSKLSDVPQGLINDINNVLNGILNLLFRTNKDKVANPRPPHVVVVANR